MRMRTSIRRKQRGQDGYALVLVVFLLALIAIAIVAAAPDVIINGRRQKEEEMIWRGKQYVRGIRLYVRYNQMHGGTTRFPTSMEDLTKNKMGVRFMRQAYKDPVNTVDGSWRLIYVGPNGQLIGSLKSRPLVPDGQNSGSLASGSGGFGSLFGGSQSSSGNNSSFGSSSFGSSSSGSSSFGNSSFGNSSFNNGGNSNAANSPGQNTAQGAPGSTSSDPMSTPQAIASSDGTADVIGGNIIGVGSKVNKASVIWYDKAKNYRQFEFIWDPSKEPVNGGVAGGIIGVPSGPAPGTPLPGSGINPQPGQNPPQ